jgi:hypothetical protein
MPTSHRVNALNGSKFSLDFSGVAGFFGGDVAVNAMSTVHIYKGRKGLGWYNMPGSWEMAKNYGRLCRSRLWNSIYPGDHLDSTEFFGLDGHDGPAYRAVHSGTHITKTGHVAYLLLQSCKRITNAVPILGRETTPCSVTIVELSNSPKQKITLHPLFAYSTFFAAIPILATLAAMVACGVFEDWYCFSMILVGALASGFSCLTLGSSTLTFTHPKPASGAPLGDGILQSGNDIIILLGEEAAVNVVTRGEFHLELYGKPQHHWIGITSLLLMIQFLVQLLLVPQGTLFGQIMFLSTLGVSWVYNSALCSLDREGAQTGILKEQILDNPPMNKFILKTRTSMAVFVLLVVAGREQATQESLNKLLEDLIPNDTRVWQAWKRTVLPSILDPSKSAELGRNWQSEGQIPEVQEEQQKPVSKEERELLWTLLEDASKAYMGYVEQGLQGRPPTLM